MVGCGFSIAERALAEPLPLRSLSLGFVKHFIGLMKGLQSHMKLPNGLINALSALMKLPICLVKPLIWLMKPTPSLMKPYISLVKAHLCLVNPIKSFKMPLQSHLDVNEQHQMTHCLPFFDLDQIID